MGNSISVSMHIGSDKNAIKTMADIKRCDLHNNRKYKNEKNEDINLSLSKYNITLKGTKNIYTDMENFYKTEFADALYNYNLKQQREDRKIVDYLTKMEKDTKTNIGVEILFQIGDKEDWKDKTLEEKQKSTDIFKTAILELEKRNIKVVNAALHLDETSPHLHVIAVPIIEGQKRGLEKQVSQNKVITREVIRELREVIEKNFIEKYNRIYGTSKELKRGSEIEEHLQAQDYKNTKKILEVAKKYGDKLELKEELENKTNQLTNELTKLGNENKEKLKRKNELENNINNIDKENQTYKEILEKNKKNLETSTAGLTAEIKELESKIKVVKQIKEDKNKELELEFINKASKIKEIEQIKEEIKKLEEQQKEDEERLKAEEKKRKDFLEEEETRKKRYEEIDAAIEKEKEKLKNKEIELQKVKKIYEDTENARLKSENDLKIANKEIEDNKNILEKTNAEIKKLNVDIETAIKNKEKLEKEKQEIAYTKSEAIEDIIKLIEKEKYELSIIDIRDKIDYFRDNKNNKILNAVAEEIKSILPNITENVDGYKVIIPENFRENIENRFGKSGNTKSINKNKYNDDIEY